MNKTMFAIYSNSLTREITADEYNYGLDMDYVFDTVMAESNCDYLEKMFSDIFIARKNLKTYECDVYAENDGHYFSAKVYWIEEIIVNESGKVIESLGTYDYIACELFPKYSD